MIKVIFFDVGGVYVKLTDNSTMDHMAKKYPAELMRKGAKAGSGSGADAEYWRIKKEYRAYKKT